MATTRYFRDRGLTLRMVLVMVYLAVVFVAAVVTLVLALGGWGVWLSIFAALVLVASWFGSHRVSMRAIGAREVTAADQPMLHGAMERLCALSGMPKPRLAVMKAWDPNAFALGRSPRATTPIPSRDLRSHAVADVFGIVPANGKKSGGLTATHPALERRLAQLARVSVELGKPTL